MSQTVTIPSCMNPFEITINNHTYSFKAGESVEIPDDVAEVIKHHVDSVPKPLDKVEEGSGSGSVATQEKTVDITENGTTEITADEGHLLSKVTANVNVGGGSSGENRLNQYFTKTLTEVKAEDLAGVITTAQSMFDGYSNLTSVTIPNSVKELSYCTFSGCGFTSIIVPNNVEIIGGSAFRSCYALTNITIGSGVTVFGQNSFQECRKLITIDIPNNVTKINNNAFNGCTALTSVTIGSGITIIDSAAFRGCTALTSITIKAETPPSLKSLAFDGVPADCPIYVKAIAVEAYKAATNWSARADYIFAIEE